MILLSSHIDRVNQEFDLFYEKGIHKGLLDNFLGILLCYLTLYDDTNLIKFEKEGKIKLWHNQGEEWGILNNPPVLGVNDIALVVDVADNPAYTGMDFSLENIWGLSEAEINKLKEMFAWEGFKALIKPFTGEEIDHDEAWIWKEKGIKTMSFIVPINATNRGWHRSDSTVSSEKIKVCRQGLKRLINYLLK